MKIFYILLLFVTTSAVLYGCNQDDVLKQAYNDLKITENLDNVTDDIYLPDSLYGVSITWLTSDANVISSYGNVMRTNKDKFVILTAILEYEDSFLSKDFVITVIKQVEKTKLEIGRASCRERV